MSLTSFEDLAAPITSGGELGVIAVAAEDFFQLGAKLLVHKRHTTLVAQETRLVPVLILVRQVLQHDHSSERVTQKLLLD